MIPAGAGLFLLVALMDWIAVARGYKRLEYVFKPAALAVLIGLALWVEPSQAAQRAWFVVALVFSLAGDVFLMLPRNLFVWGLASFLVAHLGYTTGFVAAGASVPSFVAGLAAIGVVGAWPLHRILQSLKASRKSLRVPVAAYAVAISTMVAAAFATGDALAVTGALLFYFSDLCIAWSRFVADWAWARLLIIVTYHLGQFALVASLSV